MSEDQAASAALSAADKADAKPKRGRPAGSGNKGGGKAPGKRKAVANTPPAVVADALATGLRWTTIPAVDWLGLDATYVLWRTEAEAIAAPLARLLWPYLRELGLLDNLLRKVDQGSDTYLLIMALMKYVERVGKAALAAYVQRLAAARLQAQAHTQGGGNGSARQASTVGGPSGPVAGGAIHPNAAGGAAGGAARRAPRRPDGDALNLSTAGVDGIGARFNWNGGVFGATDAFSDIPLSYQPVEAWDLAAN